MKTMDFNFSEFKNGRVATNKVGQIVKFITECRDGKFLANVKSKTGISYTQKYNKTGKLYNGTETVYDLTF